MSDDPLIEPDPLPFVPSCDPSTGWPYVNGIPTRPVDPNEVPPVVQPPPFQLPAVLYQGWIAPTHAEVQQSAADSAQTQTTP